MNPRWILNHLGTSIRYHGLALISVLSVLAFAWTMGLALSLTRKNFTTLMTLWGSSQEMNFFLAEGVTPDQRQALMTKIKADARLTEVRGFSGADLIRDLKSGENAASESGAGFNRMLEDADLMDMLPDGIQARLNPAIVDAEKAQTLKELALAWTGVPGISQATFGYDFSEQFRGLFNASNFILNCLIGCLALISVVIAYQMTHLSISVRKSEVEVLELIGASRKFVWTPFLLESALLGAFAYATAIGAVLFGFQWARETFAISPWTRAIAENMISLNGGEISTAAAVAVGLNVLGAYLSLRKIHRQAPILRTGLAE